MAAATIPCPICDKALPLDVTNAREAIGSMGATIVVDVQLSDEGRRHLRSHCPDDDGGEPQPVPQPVPRPTEEAA